MARWMPIKHDCQQCRQQVQNSKGKWFWECYICYAFLGWV